MGRADQRTVVVAEVPEGEVEDELDVDVELLLAGGARHLSHRVRGLRLRGLGQQGHGAGRAEALAREEHVGAALRDAGHIAAGAEKSVGLRGQDMQARHGVQGSAPQILAQQARARALCTRPSHRGEGVPHETRRDHRAGPRHDTPPAGIRAGDAGPDCM
jgi:hypothetical protein